MAPEDSLLMLTPLGQMMEARKVLQSRLVLLRALTRGHPRRLTLQSRRSLCPRLKVSLKNHQSRFQFPNHGLLNLRNRLRRLLLLLRRK